MKPENKSAKINKASFLALRVIYSLGNLLVCIGSITLILGMMGLFDMETLSFGISSGVRVIGTVAISGCLLSAIGYGISDYLKGK